MRGTKRFLPMLLAVVMMVSIFTVAGAEAKPELEPVKLSWYYIGGPQPDLELVQAEVNKLIEPRINATIELNSLDFGAYPDQITMKFNAQEEFDIVWTANWYNPFLANVAKHNFLPLDGLIEEYAPKTMVTLPKAVIDSARVNGVLYALPSWQQLARGWGVYMAKELADKYELKLDEVKKIEDLEPFLQKIKENEPQLYPIRLENGIVSTVLDGMKDYYEVAGAAGAWFNINTPADEIEIINIYETEQYKYMLQFMADWYKKGYIRQDIASVQDDNADFSNEKYAVTTGNMGPDSNASQTAKFGREYVSIQFTTPFIGQAGATSTMNAISSTSKNPERALMFLDIVNTDPQVYNLISWGIEGKHYKKLDDTHMELIPDSGFAPNNHWVIGNTFNSLLVPGQSAEMEAQKIEGDKTARVASLLGFTFDPTPVKTQVTNVGAVQAEYGVLVTGAADYEKLLPEFLEKLKAAGIDDVIAECQRQVDEWAKLPK